MRYSHDLLRPSTAKSCLQAEVGMRIKHIPCICRCFAPLTISKTGHPHFRWHPSTCIFAPAPPPRCPAGPPSRRHGTQGCRTRKHEKGRPPHTGHRGPIIYNMVCVGRRRGRTAREETPSAPPFFYFTSLPGRTSRSTVTTLSVPSAFSAERIMPWLSMPRRLRAGRLARKHTCLPTSCCGS